MELEQGHRRAQTCACFTQVTAHRNRDARFDDLNETMQVIHQAKAEAIVVSTRAAPSGQAVLSIWSDGDQMDQSVERNLFEPFFSSESRSSGLGLYICRELCEGHGATITYQRSRRWAREQELEGNEFFVTFRPSRRGSDGSGKSDKMPLES